MSRDPRKDRARKRRLRRRERDRERREKARTLARLRELRARLGRMLASLPVRATLTIRVKPNN